VEHGEFVVRTNNNNDVVFIPAVSRVPDGSNRNHGSNHNDIAAPSSRRGRKSIRRRRDEEIGSPASRARVAAERAAAAAAADEDHAIADVRRQQGRHAGRGKGKGKGTGTGTGTSTGTGKGKGKGKGRGSSKKRDAKSSGRASDDASGGDVWSRLYTQVTEAHRSRRLSEDGTGTTPQAMDRSSSQRLRNTTPVRPATTPTSSRKQRQQLQQIQQQQLQQQQQQKRRSFGGSVRSASPVRGNRDRPRRASASPGPRRPMAATPRSATVSAGSVRQREPGPQQPRAQEPRVAEEQRPRVVEERVEVDEMGREEEHSQNASATTWFLRDLGVQTVLRVSPFIDPGSQIPCLVPRGERDAALINNAAMSPAGSDASVPFHFDRVFDAAASQLSVYASMQQQLMDTVLDAGGDVVLLAMGSADTGKTRTVVGDEAEGGAEPGLLHMIVGDLLSTLHAREDAFDGVPPRVLYSQVHLFDPGAAVAVVDALIDPDEDDEGLASGGNCSVHGSARQGNVTVQGATLRRLARISDLDDALLDARDNVDPRLGRAHVLHTVSVADEMGSVSITVVDLAGSEDPALRPLAAGGRSGALDHLRGTTHVSQHHLLSLLNALIREGQDPQHARALPWEASTLNALLHSALSEASLLVVIAHASPDDTRIEHTLETVFVGDHLRRFGAFALDDGGAFGGQGFGSPAPFHSAGAGGTPATVVRVGPR
jgi:hypothetical protein